MQDWNFNMMSAKPFLLKVRNGSKTQNKESCHSIIDWIDLFHPKKKQSLMYQDQVLIAHRPQVNSSSPVMMIFFSLNHKIKVTMISLITDMSMKMMMTTTTIEDMMIPLASTNGIYRHHGVIKDFKRNETSDGGRSVDKAHWTISLIAKRRSNTFMKYFLLKVKLAGSLQL
jgi:hypothetical protein